MDNPPNFSLSESLSSTTAPPPYAAPDELLQWGFLLKSFLFYLTPYEIAHGPLLVCKAWYQFLSSHLRHRIHLYSPIQFQRFMEIVSEASICPPSLSFHFDSALTHQLTCLHLHGKDWESSLSSTCSSPHNIFSEVWLYTLFHKLRFLQTLELDSIPFLDECSIYYFTQHFASNKKERQLLFFKSLTLKKALLVSGILLAHLFTHLYKLGVNLETLGLVDCPGLNADFASAVQQNTWWGWTASLTFLDLRGNPHSLTSSLFNRLFHSSFSFPLLKSFSIAQSTSLSTQCVYPLLIKSPIRHLVLDDLVSWQDPIPDSVSGKLSTLSIKNISLSWFHQFLICKSPQLTSLSISLDLLQRVDLSLFRFSNLKRLIIEDTRGDGIPLTLIQAAMGLSETLPLSPYIVAIQPRKFTSYLDQVLAHDHVYTLNQRSKDICFLKLIENNTVSIW